jgi:hypothetical protein
MRAAPSDNPSNIHPQGGKTMNDMLAAFHLVRYFELREKEQEPYREVVPEQRFSVGLGIFRRLRKGLRIGRN